MSGRWRPTDGLLAGWYHTLRSSRVVHFSAGVQQKIQIDMCPTSNTKILIPGRICGMLRLIKLCRCTNCFKCSLCAFVMFDTCSYMGLDAWKPVFGVCEQPKRRPCSLITIVIVVPLLESIIPKLGAREILIYFLCSLCSWAEAVFFCMNKPRRQGFSRQGSVYFTRNHRSFDLCDSHPNNRDN